MLIDSNFLQVPLWYHFGCLLLIWPGEETPLRANVLSRNQKSQWDLFSHWIIHNGTLVNLSVSKGRSSSRSRGVFASVSKQQLQCQTAADGYKAFPLTRFSSGSLTHTHRRLACIYLLTFFFPDQYQSLGHSSRIRGSTWTKNIFCHFCAVL